MLGDARAQLESHDAHALVAELHSSVGLLPRARGAVCVAGGAAVDAAGASNRQRKGAGRAAGLPSQQPEQLGSRGLAPAEGAAELGGVGERAVARLLRAADVGGNRREALEGEPRRLRVRACVWKRGGAVARWRGGTVARWRGGAVAWWRRCMTWGV